MASGLLQAHQVLARRKLRLLALLALLASLPVHAAPELQKAGEVADVVVVGAGPTGLFAAIEAKRKGAGKVIVLERRGAVRTREQTLTLVDDVVARLAEAGVDLSQVSQVANRVELITRSGLKVRFPLLPGIAGSSRLLSAGGVLRSAISNGLGFERTNIATNKLEGALLARARELGIEVHYDSRVHAVREDGETVRATVIREGESVEVRGRFMAVTDGAHSPTLAGLGLIPKPVSGENRMMWAVFDQPGNRTLVKRALPGWGSLRRIRAITIPGPDTTAVGIDIPKEAVLDDQQREELAYQTAEKLGVKGKLIGKPSDFIAQLTRAEKVVIGKRVFVLGDAAHTSTPFAGMGVNSALDSALRFGKLYRSLDTAKNDRQADRARKWFQVRSRVGAAVMHGFSGLQLQPRPTSPKR